ncbi:hypothetical protein [Acrocarpospora macrocephala]|uniref:hypothetical protein n=1 Tax=Acrocarpospora macrocephala TaxID=150177 RepID=UPI0012D2C06F|nr:hypothetical protein [Acrocarpospora macrocephala]
MIANPSKKPARQPSMQPANDAHPIHVEPGRAALERGQQQYLHLVRLAWDLHLLGVGSAVEVGPERVPAVRIARASGPVRVMAWVTDEGAWVFTWGHSRDKRIEVWDARAASRIARLAQDD